MDKWTVERSMGIAYGVDYRQYLKLHSEQLRKMETIRQDIGGSIADRKNLAAGFDFRGDPFGMKDLQQFLRTQHRQRRVQKSSLRAVGLDDAALIGVVCDVAASPPRHQDFDARPAVLLQK